MKCKRSITLLALITLALVPAVITYATKPTTITGGMKEWTPTFEAPQVIGPNSFYYGTAETVWSGPFVGTSDETFTVVYHRYGARASFKATVSFEGIVDGKSGTLVISKQGKQIGSEDWSGTWVILSGTDELANLHGQGTWWGPGYLNDGNPGITSYDGKIHFDPS